MYNDTLHPTRRRQSVTCSLLIFIFLAILSSQILIADSQCTRRSTDTGSPPTFLCVLNVTFARQADCSARVSETLVFPHTTGQAEERVIQALRGSQQVSDIQLQRNEKSVSIRPELASDGTVLVTLPTQQSTDPITFVLTYRISNAVMRFTDGCGKGQANPVNNVMRWRSGPLDKTMDTLAVDFSTTTERSLSKLGVGGGGTASVSFFESDFTKDPDFSVEEAGGKVCPVDQQCFTRAVPIWQIGIIIAVIAIPMLLTGTCCCVFMFCDLCGIRSEVAGDEPVSDSEMVGFGTGRYTSCIPNDGFGGCECKKERELFDIE